MTMARPTQLTNYQLARVKLQTSRPQPTDQLPFATTSTIHGSETSNKVQIIVRMQAVTSEVIAHRQRRHAYGETTLSNSELPLTVVVTCGLPLAVCAGIANPTDKDGDLDVPRKIRLVLAIQEATTLDLVGRQLWPASVTLADYLLSRIALDSSHWGNSTVLELGCGVGMISLMLAHHVKLVCATDRCVPVY
jgi:2-polyprenyl-3-methyl-5-hydroxy-6-metoxy-1,4-benzoquinol methylase